MQLKDITFVIPTNKPVVKTVESIPKECSIVECRKYTRGKARTEGVKISTTEWIAFEEVDIKFTPIST